MALRPLAPPARCPEGRRYSCTRIGYSCTRFDHALTPLWSAAQSLAACPSIAFPVLSHQCEQIPSTFPVFRNWVHPRIWNRPVRACMRGTRVIRTVFLAKCAGPWVVKTLFCHLWCLVYLYISGAAQVEWSGTEDHGGNRNRRLGERSAFCVCVCAVSFHA